MARVAVDRADPAWCYEFVPSAALPEVDLSLSFKSRFLSENSLRIVSYILRRFHAPLACAYAVGMVLSVAVPYLSAPEGRIGAVLSLIIALPLGLANLSALRYELVCLVIREDNTMFFCLVNAATNVLVGIVFGDLRACAAVMNFIGWTNVVLIDGLLRGIRRFVQFNLAAMLGTWSWMVCMVSNRIDEPHGTSLWQYKDGGTVYDVSATEYVLNGLSTFLILLAKIIYRKRQSIHKSTRNLVIECVVLRCKTKLVPCSSQLAIMSRMARAPSTVDLSTSHLQRLEFVRSDQVYDGRHIVLPVRITSKSPLPRAFTRLVYFLGCAGFTLLFPSSFFVNRSQDSTARAVTTRVAFVCTASFYLVFLACSQRNLLKSLLTSFDFAFYTVQSGVTHLAAALMYNWERDFCLVLISFWLWTMWLFSLDAITPMMRVKLRFHIYYALPVAGAFLFGILVTLCGVFVVGMSPPQGHAIWSGTVLGREVTVHALPFFVARLFILMTWKMRLVRRLWKASDADALILRGAVRYENYLSTTNHDQKRLFSISAQGSAQQVVPEPPVR